MKVLKILKINKNQFSFLGTLSEEEVLKHYLARFERNGSVDGILSLDEFLDYYSCVSASIDDDVYFIVLMHNSWNL